MCYYFWSVKIVVDIKYSMKPEPEIEKSFPKAAFYSYLQLFVPGIAVLYCVCTATSGSLVNGRSAERRSTAVVACRTEQFYVSDFMVSTCLLIATVSRSVILQNSAVITDRVS